MKLFLLKILLGIAMIIIGHYINASLQPEFIGGGYILLLATIAVDGGGFALNNWDKFKFVTYSKWLSIKGEHIRFSMSYQYRIKVKDKYLLVQNSNPNWNWYQHVGGKYKITNDSFKTLKDLEVMSDFKQQTHGIKEGDLAVFVPAKNAVKFLKWFNSEKEREISHWREFYEELLGGKEEQILSGKNFPYVDYRFVKTLRSPLKRAPAESGWNCWEVLQYDVLDLLPTPKQKKELEKLLNKGDTNYIKWADVKLINNLGYDDRKQKQMYSIGAHTKWVLNLKIS